MVTRRSLEVLAVAGAVLVLAACSLQRLVFSNITTVYNNATPVLAWVVDDYVELSDAQKSWLRESLARTVAWHRARELPEYRRFFETLLVQTEDNLSVEELRSSHRELRAHYNRLLEHMLPDLAELLLQLDPEQVAQLERKLSAENRKIVKESVEGTPEERRAKRTRKYFDNLEEWTGRLSDAQRELIAARVKSIAEHLDERLGDRKYRQGELVALARARPSREQAIAGLKRLLIDSESWRRPEYLAKLRERDQQHFEMLSELSATLSAEQRAHLQKRLRTFMRDITELSASN